MTSLETVDRIEASQGPLQVNEQLPDPSILGPSALTVMRENTTLSLIGENWQRARCCELQPVRGWVDGCSPVYDIALHEHKCTATCFGSAIFKPFTFYAAEEVNCLGGPVDPQSEADRHVLRQTEWAVTTMLDHSPWEENPSLRSEALDLTPVDGTGAYQAVSIPQALAMFHMQYRHRSAGGFVLVAPTEALPFFVRDTQASNRGGSWVTSTGVPIITGGGLTGVAPTHDHLGEPKPVAPDTSAPFSGEVTLYSMRSVPEYRIGPVMQYQEIFDQAPGSLVHPRTNSAAGETVRKAAIRFDPFCVYAITVNLRAGECS